MPDRHVYVMCMTSVIAQTVVSAGPQRLSHLGIVGPATAGPAVAVLAANLALWRRSSRLSPFLQSGASLLKNEKNARQRHFYLLKFSHSDAHDRGFRRLTRCRQKTNRFSECKDEGLVPAASHYYFNVDRHCAAWR